MFKMDKEAMIITAIVVGAAILAIILGSAGMDSDAAVAIIALIIFVVLGGGWYINRLAEKYIKKQKELEKEKLLLDMAEGKWSFPGDDFFEECKKAGFTTIDSDYHERKAKAIANSIMKKYEVPNDCWNIYNSVEKLSAYLTEWGKYDEEIQAEEKEREIERLNTVYDADLSEEEQNEMQFVRTLFDVYGADKREQMASYFYKLIDDKINGLYAADQAARELEQIMVNSALQKKTSDPWILSGMANGLAGPVAGTLIGLDVMKKNEEIEAWNKENRESVRKTAHEQTEMLTKSTFEKRAELRPIRDEYEKIKDDASSKVVYDEYNINELFDSIKINEIIVNKKESNGLRISVSMSTDFNPKHNQDGIKLTVDGTLFVDVYCEETYVGQTILPLPLLGLECGKNEMVVAETILEKYMIKKKPYEVKLSPNRLWVMEL